MSIHPLQGSGQISFGDINEELGRSRTSQISLDAAENGAYGTINTLSPNKPSVTNPATLSEWYGYNHLVTFGHFGTGLNDTADCIKIQSDGKLLLGARGSGMTSYNGTGGNGFRLNINATVNFSGYSYADAIWTYSDYSALFASELIKKYNASGTENATFTTNTGSGPEGINPAYGYAHVKDIVVQSDGKIICVGSFTSWNGASQNSIVRLNTTGTRDTSYAIGSGFTGGYDSTGEVNAIVIQSDGKIIAGGGFNTFNVGSVGHIARLTTGGSLDTSFNIGSGFNTAVHDMIIQSDGKIICVGDFTSYNGTSVGRIARLSSTGALDTGFIVGTGFNGSISSVDIFPLNGNILVAGQFTSYNGVAIPGYVAILNSSGVLQTSFSSQLNGSVTQAIVNTYTHTSIYTIGTFTSSGSVLTQFIAKLDLNGNSFVTDTTPPSAPSGLYASAIYATSIDLAWSSASDNVAVTEYAVYKNGSLLANLGNVLTYTATGLVSGTSYTFNVYAKDAAGNMSSASNTINPTTIANPSYTLFLELEGNGDYVNMYVYVNGNYVMSDEVYGYNSSDTFNSQVEEGDFVQVYASSYNYNSSHTLYAYAYHNSNMNVITSGSDYGTDPYVEISFYMPAYDVRTRNF